MKTVKISDYGKSTNGAVWYFTQGKLQEMLNAQAKLTHKEMIEKYSPFLDDDEEARPGIECVCEFKPISYGTVFVFENKKETVLLSETGTQCIPKDGSASTVDCSTWRAMPSLAHRIARYQHSGYKQIG